MGATVEIDVSIRLDPDTEHTASVSIAAEHIVNEVFCVHADTVSDVLVEAENALENARLTCQQRARAEF